MFDGKLKIKREGDVVRASMVLPTPSGPLEWHDAVKSEVDDQGDAETVLRDRARHVASFLSLDQMVNPRTVRAAEGLYARFVNPTTRDTTKNQIARLNASKNSPAFDLSYALQRIMKSRAAALKRGEKEGIGEWAPRSLYHAGASEVPSVSENSVSNTEEDALLGEIQTVCPPASVAGMNLVDAAYAGDERALEHLRMIRDLAEAGVPKAQAAMETIRAHVAGDEPEVNSLYRAGVYEVGLAPAIPAAVSAAPAVAEKVKDIWSSVFGGKTKPPPGEVPGRMKLANQHGSFTLAAPTLVYYRGPNGNEVNAQLPAGTHVCNAPLFGGADPQKGANKACYVVAEDAKQAAPGTVAMTPPSPGMKSPLPKDANPWVVGGIVAGAAVLVGGLAVALGKRR